MTWDAWNPIRLLGDLSHLAAKCILIWAIHRNRSAEGVSLITQVLYATVFCSRYLDLPWETSRWNFLFKIVYILSSFYTIAAMRFLFPRSRERETAWKLGAAAFGGSLLVSPFVMMIFERHWGFLSWMWVLSQILESVAVLPQLLLLRQTTVPTVIDSFYLVALGSYRALYVVNWFVRGLEMHGSPPNPVSVIFGVIQTILYIDFAWVYYTRQRVKLRNGGIVDADDIRRGWIIGHIFGKASDGDEDADEEAGLTGNSRRPNRAKWGTRGISVSADDGILATERDNREHDEDLEGADPDAKMRDPDELAKVLNDDSDDDSGPSARPSNSQAQSSGVNNGGEWRD
jgi:hypothetical protein